MTTLHGSVRRLALLGAVCIAVSASSALGGLGSTPAAGAAAPPSGSRMASAATPPFLSQMARALGRVRSYQVAVQTAGAGYGSDVTTTSTEILVRRGTTFLVHLTAVTRRAGQVSTVEEVFTGTRLCLRTGARSAWSCQMERSSALAHLYAAGAAHLAKSFSPRQRYVPVGRQTRQGQACAGYRFNLAGSGLQSQGTLWIARATALPVEEDVVSTLVLAKGAPHLVVRMTQLWSRWNDPGLTIPAVPHS